MSHSDRDRRGRPHSDKRCPESAAGHCAYCVTGRAKGPARRAERQRGRHEVHEQLAQARRIDSVDDRIDESDDMYDEHVFVAGRCLRCDVDWIDGSIYEELRVCPGKDQDAPISYHTSSDGEVSSSHCID